MAEITLVADTGRVSGSSASRRLRAAGKIPAVVYGHGTDPIAVSVDARELRNALNTEAGVNALLTLKLADGDHLTMARMLQRHPVRHTVTHVDFQIVRRDEIISAEVPFHLVGEAKELANQDGVVDQQMFSLTVNATPGKVPQNIEIDITSLAIGDAIRVGDLKLPAGVTTDTDADDPIVVAQGAMSVEDLEAAEAEAVELGEGATDADPEASTEESGEAGENDGAAGSADTSGE